MRLAFAQSPEAASISPMFKRAFVPGLVLLLGASVFWWTMTSPFWTSLRRVSAIMRVINTEYYDPGRADYNRLADAAIAGMARSLDQHSRYMPADDYAHFEQMTHQAYVGIGVQIERFAERVMVVHVFPGGPAADVGILPGDRFLTIEGEDVTGATVREVSERLRGPAGEQTSVTVHRPATDEELSIELVRRTVDVASVDNAHVDKSGIGYLRILQFGERTTAEFREALEELEEAGMEALVIDLRNNPGGLINTSKDVAAEFFERNELIVYTEGRNRIDRREYRSGGPARLRNYPVAVLINGQSASGAEIVAGALQDSGRAYIVGETSFGKGSVQSVYAFKNGDGLRQTTALYYLPSGRSIHESGVVPDEIVEHSEEETLRLVLQERHADLMDPEEFERHFEFAPEIIDRQLEAARRHLLETLARKLPATA